MLCKHCRLHYFSANVSLKGLSGCSSVPVSSSLIPGRAELSFSPHGSVEAGLGCRVSVGQLKAVLHYHEQTWHDWLWWNRQTDREIGRSWYLLFTALIHSEQPVRAQAVALNESARWGRKEADRRPTGVNQIVTESRGGDSARDDEAARGDTHSQRRVSSSWTLLLRFLISVALVPPRSENVQKESSQTGPLGETSRCFGQHDSPSAGLLLTGVCRMKTA